MDELIWCITGAGHLLKETVEAMEDLSKRYSITAAYSKAGAEISQMYGLEDRISKLSKEVIHPKSQGASAPVSASRRFGVAVVAPATANTVAKIVCGIADTVPTNVVAQSLKVGRKVVVLPTDQVREIETAVPSGNMVSLTARDIDLKNVEGLKRVEGVVVTASPEELKSCL